jgi:ABC-type transport system substrate-binding protein
MLKEAGYTIPASGGNVREDGEGHRLSFEMLYPDDPRYKAFAEWIASDWERLGVGVELKPVPYAELVSDYLEPRKYQAAFVA